MLKIKGPKFEVAFNESYDPMDPSIAIFLKRMLVDTHTIPGNKKIFRKEARKVFVKEICKNIMENETFKSSQERPLINLKVMQNYSGVLIISKFLT